MGFVWSEALSQPALETALEVVRLLIIIIIIIIIGVRGNFETDLFFL